MSASQTKTYRFSEFELDPAERRLLRAGEPIALTPKVFDTLVLLVQRAGHVVTKEELIATVWPRGFVDESNLTKHIWLIRKALGESESTSPCIETVPKLGYRFVAPVEAVDPTQVIPPPAASPADDRPRVDAPPFRLRGVLAATAIAVALIAFAGWRWWESAAGPRHTGHTIALLGFSNLSRNPKDAWIAPAMTEMLSAELNAASSLHVVPDERVRSVSTGLGPPGASGYSAPTLSRLARQLDADYVISGSYLVGNSSDATPVRIEMAVQDTRTGDVIGAPSFQVEISQLTAVARDAGEAFRGFLHSSAPDPRLLGLVANSLPPNVDVARRIGFALDALHHFDAARARDELLESIAASPGYPLAYTYLAQAWSQLGYSQKALAAAEQAVRYSGNLSEEQRLQAQAMAAATRSDWPRAALVWQTLQRLRPSNTEYGPQAIDALMRSGHYTEARNSLQELRRRPEAMQDPRLDLLAARLAEQADDVRLEATDAELALQHAQAHELAGVAADAQLQLAGARERLGDMQHARESLESAAAVYRTIRNPRGEAAAHVALGRLALAEHHAQSAREEFQQALALNQGIGDQAGIAAVYREICEMLWVAGDRDGAQTAARQILSLSRETGDLRLQSWGLRALATAAADEMASDEVIKDYREVIALNEKVSDRGGYIWSLATLADVERLRGALDEALSDCRRAQAKAAELSDPQFLIYSNFTCATVEFDRGDASAARATLREVIETASNARYQASIENARVLLAQMDMDERAWATARDRLRQASRGFAADEVETGEADADALLALCAQALGDRAQREQAASRARQLRESITSRQEVFQVDIALAQLEAVRDSSGVDKLLSLAADAAQRHFIAWSLEARLAAWEVLRARKSGADADAVREQLQADARKAGFGRILNRLRTDGQQAG